MTVVIQKTQSRTSRVALATAWSHQQRDHLVIETDLDELADAPGLASVPVVVDVELDVVEIVVDDALDWNLLRKTILRLAVDFTRIVVLVPSAAMGTAHRELRGAPGVLQQWWFEGAAARFGTEELL
jgi:hypothetical protein